MVLLTGEFTLGKNMLVATVAAPGNPAGPAPHVRIKAAEGDFPDALDQRIWTGRV